MPKSNNIGAKASDLVGNIAFSAGDLLDLNYGNKGLSDATRGISCGGEGPSSSAGLNVIEYFTMASSGNGVDFGDMQSSARYRGSSSGD